MEAFSELLALCVGNSPVTGEFPAQRPVTQSFDVFFDLRLNEWLGKQSWGWWFQTSSRPLWRQSNGQISFMARQFPANSSVYSLCVWKPLVAGGFPAQKGSNVESVPRHRDIMA